MAKAKHTSKADSPKVSADILRQLDELAVGISKVSGTAKCVHLALFNQAGYGSRELAVCIRDHIVTELRRLHRQIQSIETVLGGRLPFSDEEDMRSLVE